MAALAASSAAAIRCAPSRQPIPGLLPQRLSCLVHRRPAYPGRRRAALAVRGAAAELAEPTAASAVLEAALPVPEVELPEVEPAGPAPSFLSGLVENSKALLTDAVEAVSDAAESAVDSASSFATSAAESALDMVDSVKDSGKELLDKASSTVTAASTPQEAAEPAAPESSLQTLAEEPALPGVESADVTSADVTSFDLPDAVDAADSAPADAFLPPPEDIAPQLGGPKFQVKVPEFRKPDFNLPDFKSPEFSLPEFKAPEFSLPQFKKPDFSLPDFKAPDFTTPDFKAPEFKAPEFTLPDLSQPDLSLPDSIKLPDIPTPQFSLPDSIKSRLPELPKLPELPSLPTPSLSEIRERVPLPKLSLPPGVTEPIKQAAADASAAVEAKAALVSALLLEKAAQLYEQAKGQVPEEYAPYVSKVESNLESFWSVASVFSRDAALKFGAVSSDVVRSAYGAAGYEADEGVVSVTLVVLSATVLSVLYYRAVYGGYSGDLSPEESLKLLKESKAVLLDLRSDALRAQDGIPDLRRGARFKDRYLEFQKYSGPIRKQLRNPETVDLQLFAATVKGLKGVSGGTSVVVMDDTGSAQAKDIARALARFGFERSYILSGGFKRWVADGLFVKPDEPEALADILQNEFESFIEEVKPTPEQVVNAAVITGVGIYALYEWERSFQILGALLVAQIIYSRARTYESAADLQRDVKFVTAPVVLVATVLGWILKAAGLGPASTSAAPKLATARATSAEEEEEGQEGKAAAALPETSAATATAAPADTEAAAPAETGPEVSGAIGQEEASSSPAGADAAKEETGPAPATEAADETEVSTKVALSNGSAATASQEGSSSSADSAPAPAPAPTTSSKD